MAIKKPEISIIVPVYNNEKFLPKMLRSLFNQTFKNFELILINDGSTDSSLSIMRTFQNKFSDCKILDIENGGVSHARNIGIEASCGNYISFVDSDDYVSKRFLEILYSDLIKSNADVSCCNYCLYYPKIKLKIPDFFALSSGIYEPRKILKSLIFDFRIHSFLWNKLWKRSLFVKNNIKFPDTCFEDTAVLPILFYDAKKISVNSAPLYYYTQHSESTVSPGCMNEKKINDYIKSFEKIREFLESKNDYDYYRKSHAFLGYKIILISLFVHFEQSYKKNKQFKTVLSDFKKSYKKILSLINKK